MIWPSILSGLSVPDEGYSRNVPDEGYSRNVHVPDEGYSRNVPDEGYSRNVHVPDEGYSRNASSALNLISTFALYVCVFFLTSSIIQFSTVQTKT